MKTRIAFAGGVIVGMGISGYFIAKKIVKFAFSEEGYALFTEYATTKIADAIYGKEDKQRK